MSEHEREEPPWTGGEEQEPRAGADVEYRRGNDSGCAVEPEENTDTDYRDSVNETLAGDPTKLGRP